MHCKACVRRETYRANERLGRTCLCIQEALEDRKKLVTALTDLLDERFVLERLLGAPQEVERKRLQSKLDKRPLLFVVEPATQREAEHDGKVRRALKRVVQSHRHVHRLHQGVQAREARVDAVHVVLGKERGIDRALLKRLLQCRDDRFAERRELSALRADRGWCIGQVLQRLGGILQEARLDVAHKVHTHIVPQPLERAHVPRFVVYTQVHVLHQQQQVGDALRLCREARQEFRERGNQRVAARLDRKHAVFFDATLAREPDGGHEHLDGDAFFGLRQIRFCVEQDIEVRLPRMQRLDRIPQCLGRDADAAEIRAQQGHVVSDVLVDVARLELLQLLIVLDEERNERANLRVAPAFVLQQLKEKGGGRDADFGIHVKDVNRQNAAVVVREHAILVRRFEHRKSSSAHAEIEVIERHIDHALFVGIGERLERLGMRLDTDALHRTQRAQTHARFRIAERRAEVPEVEFLEVLRWVLFEQSAELLDAIQADRRVDVAHARHKHAAHEVVDVRVERVAHRVELLHPLRRVRETRPVRARLFRLGVALALGDVVAIARRLELRRQRAEHPHGHDRARVPERAQRGLGELRKPRLERVEKVVVAHDLGLGRVVQQALQQPRGVLAHWAHGLGPRHDRILGDGILRKRRLDLFERIRERVGRRHLVARDARVAPTQPEQERDKLRECVERLALERHDPVFGRLLEAHVRAEDRVWVSHSTY